MKRSMPLVLLMPGLAVIVAGFIYDVLFAGIPYQDPTPALEASYEFHSRVASIIRWSGLGAFMIGGVLMTVRYLKRPRL